MIKKTLLIAAIAATITATAQDKNEGQKGVWKKTGVLSFLLNQSTFSNWVSGGDNTVSGNIGLNYNFNYTKNDISWDNKLIIAYGINNVQGQGSKKTDDVFQFNSLAGKKATGNWLYSFFLNFKTQFTNGYDYGTTPKTKTSAFLAPGYLSFGPGMTWEKSKNFKINLAPISSKFTFVSDEFSGKYGTDPGKNLRYEFGFNASVLYKVNLMENVSMENLFNAYSNYLKKPQNVDIQYQMILNMQINKYLSTNLNLNLVMDDDASSKVQFKEVFGLSVNYKF